MFTPKDVNLERVLHEIDTLAQIGRQPSGGMTRYTFSKEHQQATKQVADWMHAAGLDVTFDRWFNLYGRTSGFAKIKCVMSGSHLDSVPNGGSYDGPLGVLSALEAVRMILTGGATLKKPLEVVSFIEEEGARFSGLLGSRLATGRIGRDAVMEMTDRHNTRFLDALAELDFPYAVKEPHQLTERVESYVELHIEQGRRLEDAGLAVGAVTGIAGPNFLRVTFTGRSDHAGATAYADRHDTLLAAAEVIVGVREAGVTQFEGRGHMTVGYVNAKPNVMNVVAGETTIEVDFRAVDDATADAMKAAVERLVQAACDKHGLTYDVVGMQSVPAAHTPPHILTAVEAGAKAAGVAYQPIVSWAAHDAMVMSNVCDAGMIFVACKDGRSHTPEEYTKPEDIAAGIATLANTLLTLAT